MTTNENAKWDKMVSDFINYYQFTNANSHKEVFTKVNDYLQNEYKGKASKEYIQSVAADVVESICLKLKIPMDFKED